MTQRITDLTLSVLASVAAFLLSWPFWRSFSYWAESQVAWWIYFVLGFLLSVYVFYAFLSSLHMLFLHDAPAPEVLAKKPPQASGARAKGEGS